MKLKVSLPLALLLASAAPLFAEDVYRSIPLNQLKVAGEALPADQIHGSWRWAAHVPDEIVTNGSGDAVLVERDDGIEQPIGARRVIFKVPEGATVSGKTGFSTFGQRDKPLRLDRTYTFSATEGTPATAEEFNTAKVRYYNSLISADLPGEGWFRYQRDHYSALLKTPAKPDPNAIRTREFSRRSNDGTGLALFTGDAAIRDNLQLDRPLRLDADVGERTVDIKTLEGITVKEFDWSTVLKAGDTALDPLAACIPADQHVVFFKSFDGMIRMLDEAEARGTPLLTATMARPEDARTKARYQRQLCLDVTELARTAGPYLVDGIAFTGSDLYLPTGSDVGIAFSTKQPDLLVAFFRAKQALAAKSDAGCAAKSGEHSGVAWFGVVNGDRTISSFVAAGNGKVFVSNSLAQLHGLLDASSGVTPSLAKLPEFKFFRQRYPLGDADETALVYVSDATIRRWCGPRWRILAARRASAAAALTTAAAGGVADSKAPAPVSAEHGTLAFMTPLAELPCDKVTPAEAAAYKLWRDGYQRGWRQFFDPIAIRFSMTDKKYAADVTVMPMILGGEYTEMVAFARNGEIRADAGDRRPGALLQYALAIDPASRHIKSMEGMFGGSSGMRSSPRGGSGNGVEDALDALKPKPFSWLGTSLSLRLDSNETVKEIAALTDAKGAESKEFEHAMGSRWKKLPLSLWIDSRDQTSLAFFLTSLRGMVDSSAPGILTWTPTEYAKQPYVTIAGPAPTPRADDDGDGSDRNFATGLKIHYHAGAKGLFVTLDEATMKAYLDASASPEAGKKSVPWLGKHACLRADGAMLNLFEGLARDGYRTSVQRASWSALPVLNELHRAAPDRDPVALYEKLWAVALTCPAGGRYVWDEKTGTMESTVTGSPVAPKEFRPARVVLPGIASGEFGLTFEHDGVRAKIDLTREASK